MPNAEQYAILLYFRTEVVADALTRVLNDAVTRDPRSDAYLPRQLDVAQPRTLLWWDQPALTFDDGGHVIASVALAGGVRQAGLPLDSGRIASVDGTLRVRAQPVLGYTASVPHLLLDLGALDLTGLRVHYAGSNPLPLLGIGGARNTVVAALVKDAAATLAAQPLLSDFMGALGRRPMSYVPAAFPHPSAAETGTLHIFGSGVGGVLAIGVGASGTPVSGTIAANALEGRNESNVAVALSGAYLQVKLERLLASGQLSQSLWDTAGSELARLDALSAQLGVGRMMLRGHATRGAAGASLSVELGLEVDAKTGQVTVNAGPTQVELDTVRSEPNGTLEMAAPDALYTLPERFSRTYWQEVVAALLGGRVEGDALDLTQRYVVPGTGVTVDAPTVGVDLTPDTLKLYSAIRCDAAFLPEPPRRAPRVTIAQQHVPSQPAPRTPVQATVAAEIISTSYPPYDFAWEADPAIGEMDTHAQVITVRGTPLGMSGDPEGIARVQVSLIDSFGQVARHDAQVMAHPAQQRQQKRQEKQQLRLRGPLKVLLPAALAVILVVSGAAVVFSHLGPKPPIATPVLSVLPQTAYSQTCQPAVPTLTGIPVTLDNTGSTVAITWHAAVQGSAPGSAEPWARVDNTSGTVPARGREVVTITPAADLCSRLQGATTQQVFSVTLTYSAAQQAQDEGSREAADAAGATRLGMLAQVASAATTRQVTITDAIASVNFSAYVEARGGQTTTSLNATCDANFALTPATFFIVLDNTKSSADASWQISIPDEAAPPAGAATSVGTPVPTPTPSATPLTPEPWAQAELTSGTLAAGQRSRVGIIPVKDLCSRIGPGTAPAPFRVLVTLGDGSTIPISATVTPTAPVIAFAVTVIDKAATSFTSIAQNCFALTPFVVALDNRESNVPVSWTVSITDSVYSTGVPTPTPGPAEVWATADITSGTAAPGVAGIARVTVTPASDLCQSLPTSTGTFTYNYTLIVSYTGGQQVTITDAITKDGVPG